MGSFIGVPQWKLPGILDYLTGASVDARILRDNFVFKIVPMLNPDAGLLLRKLNSVTIMGIYTYMYK